VRDRWFFIIAGALFVALILTALLTGDAVWAIPIAILAVIALGYFAVEKLIAQRTIARHGGDPEAALSDADEGGLPKTHLLTDDDTALGDTSEAHSEISPRDYPKGTPERKAAEELAAESGDERETTGHEDPSRRFGRTEPAPGKEEGYPEQEPSAPRGRS
jgi:hypothetical protein